MGTTTNDATIALAEEQVAGNVQQDAMDAQDEQSNENIQETQDDVQEGNVSPFARILGNDNAETEKTRDDIIRELLASENCQRVNNLTVRNVVATKFDSHTLLTFVVNEFVCGDVRSKQTDAFGQPIIELGKTHNVQTSSFAVAGVMKDTPKLAIFAADIIDRPEMANLLFAGAKIDVIMEFVPARTSYKNPFASNAGEVVFNRDKVLHHVIRLELGEVGRDLYQATLLR